MHLSSEEFKKAILEIYKGVPMENSSIRFTDAKRKEYLTLKSEIQQTINARARNRACRRTRAA